MWYIEYKASQDATYNFHFSFFFFFLNNWRILSASYSPKLWQCSNLRSGQEVQHECYIEIDQGDNSTNFKNIHLIFWFGAEYLISGTGILLGFVFQARRNKKNTVCLMFMNTSSLHMLSVVVNRVQRIRKSRHLWLFIALFITLITKHNLVQHYLFDFVHFDLPYKP